MVTLDECACVSLGISTICGEIGDQDLSVLVSPEAIDVYKDADYDVTLATEKGMTQPHIILDSLLTDIPACILHRAVYRL